MSCFVAKRDKGTESKLCSTGVAVKTMCQQKSIHYMLGKQCNSWEIKKKKSN